MFGNVIKRTIDNSYVITKDGYPYHVPNEGEFINLWIQVDSYALNNPDKVTVEIPYVPTPKETIESMQAIVMNAVQEYMDKFAKTKNYDNMFTLISYANDPNPIFSMEGQYGIAMRSQIWSTANDIFNQYLNGIRPIPTELTQEIIDNFILELPVLEWPNV